MMVGPTLQAAPRLVVLGELASGGMGTVWLAQIEGQPDQLVALKRMHQQLLRDATFLTMFLDEMWMTGALIHRNVVSPVASGVDHRGPYIVTELVRGAPLYALLREGSASDERLPAPVAAHLIAEVAEGLHAAHHLLSAEGEPLQLVHRDLTPGNILLGLDGAVKIADFGVAKATRKIGHTMTGTLKGKLHYMAPEYVAGEALDGRADLYSLGVVLYELLAGKRPFQGLGDVELMKTAGARTPAPPLSAVDPSIDPELAAIADKLVAARAAQRFSSGREVCEAVSGWLARRGHDRSECKRQLARHVERHAREQERKIERIIREALERSSLEMFEAESTPMRNSRRGAAGDRQTRAVGPPIGAGAGLAFPPPLPIPQPSGPETRALATARSEPPIAAREPPTDLSASRPAADRGSLAATPARAQNKPLLAIGALVAAALGGLAALWLNRSDVAARAPRANAAKAEAVSAEPVSAAAASAATPMPLTSAAPSALIPSARAGETAAGPRPGQPSPPAQPLPPASAAASAPRRINSAVPSAANRTPPPPARPLSAPCTPADFDYPNCKQ